MKHALALIACLAGAQAQAYGVAGSKAVAIPASLPPAAMTIPEPTKIPQVPMIALACVLGLEAAEETLRLPEIDQFINDRSDLLAALCSAMESGVLKN